MRWEEEKRGKRREINTGARVMFTVVFCEVCSSWIYLGVRPCCSYQQGQILLLSEMNHMFCQLQSYGSLISFVELFVLRPLKRFRSCD